MAELLYRLAKSCARRGWIVLLAWLLALGAAAGAYAAWGGNLTNTVTIPGTPTAEVTDRLAQELPEAAGGTGTIVFSTEDGSALTAQQQEGISDLLTHVAGVAGVAQVVDPFQAQSQREQQAEELRAGAAQLQEGRAQAEAGQAQLDAARGELEAGQAQLDAAREELTTGQEQLAAARAQAEADGSIAVAGPALQAQQDQLDAGLAQLADQQAELDAGLAQLNTQEATLQEGLAQIEASEPQLAAGQTLLDAADGIRTISEDGTTALAAVVFDTPTIEIAPEVREELTALAQDAAIPGVDVNLSNDLVMGMPALGGIAEVIGVVVAAIVLIVMLGTLVAAGLPILNALLGVGVAALATLALSGSIDMMSVTPILGVMLGLAVGIDYSLFILNRHRRQLRERMPVLESIGLANGTSGNAVVFAGATVVIALLALNLTGIPFLGLMGTVAAAAVIIAVLVAITLTPALLGMLGLRLLPRRQRTERVAVLAEKVKPLPTWRAWLHVVAGIAALAIVALPATSMRLGLPDGTTEDVNSTQYLAYTTTAQAFGEGVNGPLVVVADLPTPVTEEAELTLLQADLTSDLMAQENVVAVAPAAVNEAGTVAIFQVIPTEGPNGATTQDLVHTLRDLTPSTHPDVTLQVAGFASGNIDVSEKLADALPVYLLVVVGLSILILIVVFRSILVPLIATGGFVLSVLAAFGGVTAIYQWGWLGGLLGVHDPAPILSFLPILLVGILFGLAMDYQLFLTSGMREAYVHGSPARRAVAEGFHAGRAVVTAAAIIMISVFGGFVFSHTAIIRPIGFGLAFGVLLDAFVVRMPIMPALMTLIGDKAWWLPRWLDRLLPDVDVEGARLERRHLNPAGNGASTAAAGAGDGEDAAGAGGEVPDHDAVAPARG